MRFDWPVFLASHGIAYRVDSDAELSIRCPFCGEADRSTNMAVSLRGRGWHCWRNHEHRGRSNANLIRALIGCSRERAQEIAGEQGPATPIDSDFGTAIANLLGMDERVPPPPTELTLPREARPLQTKSLLAAAFVNYLRRRGFDEADMDWLAEHYQLHVARRGDWAYRIIIPIYDSMRRLVTWTGRSVRADEPIRYKTLSTKPGQTPRALAAPGQLLLGLPLLFGCSNPRVLLLCEGPFDALRLTVSGAKHGVYATCLFGLRLSPEQEALLSQLSNRFRRLRVLLDRDAQFVSFPLVERLSYLGCRSLQLPEGYKDPGELSTEDATRLAKSLI